MNIKTSAKKTSRWINWQAMKTGEFITEKKWRLFTTVIPDVIDIVLGKCYEVQSDYEIKMLCPNGFTTASLDFLIYAKDFEITVSRRLVRGWFPFNPIAAEFGKNYDVIFSIEAPEKLTNEFVLLLNEYKSN